MACGRYTAVAVTIVSMALVTAVKGFRIADCGSRIGEMEKRSDAAVKERRFAIGH